MERRRHNVQLFALAEPPPGSIDLGGGTYRLARVFKHDFFAATCLYERRDARNGAKAEGLPSAGLARVVVKFGRRQDFCGLPLAWYAGMLRDREEAIYGLLAGIPGVPRWMGRIGRTGYAIEYVEGRALDQPPAPPTGFFDDLRRIFDAIHARGVAYCDANKRSNILIAEDGRPFLIDYQIAIRRRDDLPRPLRAVVRAAVDYMCRKDLYHLYKHKRRISPSELTSEEEALSRRRGCLHSMHAAIAGPYRRLRRLFLRRQHEAGRLVSPTADREDRCQPEKGTWRKPLDRP